MLRGKVCLRVYYHCWPTCLCVWNKTVTYIIRCSPPHSYWVILSVCVCVGYFLCAVDTHRVGAFLTPHIILWQCHSNPVSHHRTFWKYFRWLTLKNKNPPSEWLWTLPLDSMTSIHIHIMGGTMIFIRAVTYLHYKETRVSGAFKISLISFS